MLRIFVKSIAYLFYKAMFWSKWLNKKELRKYRGKPVILAFNHRNGLDGTTIFVDVHRHAHFWIKEEFFKTPVWRAIWKSFGGIPVKPGAELGLMRASQKVLNKNRALVVLPEGHRTFGSSDEKIQIRNGVAMVALHTGAPIIPIVSDRQIKLFRLTKFKVGQAIDPQTYLQDGRVTKAGIEQLGTALQTQMQNLLQGFEKKEKLKKWQAAPNIIARGIVIRGQQLLCIKRQRNGETFYVLPGGHKEPNEDILTTCSREVIEETGVNVRPFRDLYKYWYVDKHGRGNGYQTFYVCEYLDGEPHQTDAEEYTMPNRIAGTYEPMWLNLADVKKVDLRPAVMKKQLLKDYRKKGARLSFPLRLLKNKQK